MRQDLEERMEQMLQSFRQTRARLTEANALARDATGWARSDDGLVSCSVAAGGVVTDLTIDPRAMRRYDAAGLAATIQEVIAAATAQLQAYIANQYREVVGDELDPEALTDPDNAAEAIRKMRERLDGE